jgi:hypothetical protein
MTRMLTHGVSVFGSCPPVSVVTTGVGDAEASGVELADGAAEAEAEAEVDGDADSDGVALAEGVSVATGGVTTGGVEVETVGDAETAAAHRSLVMVLVSRVTAPLLANS